MNFRHFLLPLAVATAAGAATTVYGPSGIHFVPTAFPADDGRWGGAAGGSVDRDPLGLVAVRASFLDQRLELGVSNAWRLVEGDSVGWNPGTLPVPIVPSAKWTLALETRGRQTWSYAVGASMPLGVWAAAGLRLRLPYLSPAFHAGLGTPVNSAEAFGGLVLDLCDGNGNPLPVSLAADGSVSGSTGTLGQTEEAFWSVGVTTRLGRNLSFQVVHRRDRDYSAPGGSREDGTSLLRVLWNFGNVREGASR